MSRSTQVTNFYAGTITGFVFYFVRNHVRDIETPVVPRADLIRFVLSSADNTYNVKYIINGGSEGRIPAQFLTSSSNLKLSRTQRSSRPSVSFSDSSASLLTSPPPSKRKKMKINHEVAETGKENPDQPSTQKKKRSKKRNAHNFKVTTHSARM